MRSFRPTRPKANIPKRSKLLGFLLSKGVQFSEYAGKTNDEIFMIARRHGFFNRSGGTVQSVQPVKPPRISY